MDYPEQQPLVVLVAEDDATDRLLMEEAITKNNLPYRTRFVEDGEELMEYLNCSDRYAYLQQTDLPDLILLDLKMPRKDGREVLREIKMRADLRHIPIVVFATSRMEEDVASSYALGCNSYIAKPVSYDELVELLENFHRYWGKVVQLPGGHMRKTG